MHAENHLDDIEAKWFAVFTRYRCEKMAYQQLARRGIETYLPIQQLVRQYSRKRKVIDMPLINCYVFVKIKKVEYVKVLSTQYVQSFLKFSDNLISIPEKEIELMKRILGEGWEVQAVETHWQKGDIVEIKTGGLAGLRGRLIEKNNEQLFTIALERLGMALQMKVNQSDLLKIGTE